MLPMETPVLKDPDVSVKDSLSEGKEVLCNVAENEVMNAVLDEEAMLLSKTPLPDDREVVAGEVILLEDMKLVCNVEGGEVDSAVLREAMLLDEVPEIIEDDMERSGADSMVVYVTGPE